jgi:hypothetical protein
VAWSTAKSFDVARFLMGGLFLVSAALQWNDPDPLRWAVLYALAGVASLVPLRGRGGWLLPAVVGLAALVWAGLLAPEVVPVMELLDLFGSMKAETPTIESSRELLGLLLVAGWMAVLVVAARRRSAVPAR